MARFNPSRILLLLLLIPGFARGSADWSHLKIGMTAEQTLTALGEPLLRSAGLGFEVWIYDHESEVILYGPLIGWTSPGAGTVAVRSVDVWQKWPGSDKVAQFFLPRPVKAPKKIVRSGGGASGQALPDYRQRR